MKSKQIREIIDLKIKHLKTAEENYLSQKKHIEEEIKGIQSQCKHPTSRVILHMARRCTVCDAYIKGNPR